MSGLAPLQSPQAEDTEFTHFPEPARRTIRRAVLVGVVQGRRMIWELDGREMVIGRSTACEIPIPADLAASRRHAVVRPRRGARLDLTQMEIEDLTSLNGTLVNHERIERVTVLKEHDKVCVGHTIFEFLLREEDELAAERDLLLRATSDGLTGLLNRAAFDNQLSLEVDRSRRYGRPLALIMVDVDAFKSVNDRFGHVMGDKVLAAVGRRIKAALRSCDIAGRYGGEELAILLPETSLEGAFLAAERVRTAVAETEVNDAAGRLKVTVSAGVAALSSAHTDVAGLIRSADSALYKAKNNGRNRTCTATE